MPVIVELHEDCYRCPLPMLAASTSEVMADSKGWGDETVMERTCIIRCEHAPVCMVINKEENDG